MTDNEIIKALECCFVKTNCTDCPCHVEKPYTEDCLKVAAKNAIDLMKRQKAEIDRLKKDNEYILMQHKFQRRPSGDCWNDVIEKAKAEAIKEFAERLKEAPIKMGVPLLGLQTKSEIEEYFNGILLQFRDAIDDLVKEMTEG